MPFVSLSDAINKSFQKNDRSQQANAPLRSTTSFYRNPLIYNNDTIDEEVNVLKWGSSTWGVEKVTSQYKPTQ